METKKLLLIIMLVILPAAIKAQVTCLAFCVTDIKMTTDTTLSVNIYMDDSPNIFIGYTFVQAITDHNGQKIATNTMDLFGQIGGTIATYTVYTNLKSFPTDFIGTVHFSFHTLGDSSTVTQYLCPLSYPCSTVGTDDIVSEEIKIYPNPVNANAALHIDGVPDNSYLMLTDMMGREVLKEHISNSSMQLNKNILQKGMYLYKIIHDRTVLKTGKLIIQYGFE